MALLRSGDKRKRTKHFDLEAAMTHGESSRLTRALAPERLLDTLVAVLFCALGTLVLTVGVRGVDAATIAGTGILLGAATLAMGLYVHEHHEELLADRRRLVAVQAMTAVVFVLAKVFLLFEWPVYLLPLGVFAIALSIAEGQRFAVVWTLLVALVVGFVTGAPGARLPIAATLALGTVVGLMILGPRVTRRTKVIRAGVAAGFTFAVLAIATEVLLRGRGAFMDQVQNHPKELALLCGAGFLNGLFTGYFMVEFGLRFVENVFEEVTDLRLMELSDLNQPILKKFALEAPGTFHHSQMVGTLAEAAAEAIGANALLCRVGAHFHDLGKIVKPEYYIENMTGGAPTKHEGLTPRMSTMIIVAHVKDGIEMAEELGLPRRVIDFIPEHHGTIAVEYFYHQAVKQQEREGGPPVSKDDFRYPGPMPRTSETAILMIADSVEAISRVLSEPNPARIEQMIHDVVMRRLNEGQFDECAITLAELKKVEQAMKRVLMGVFHGRIKYPKAATIDRPSQADVDDAASLATPTPVQGAAAGRAANGAQGNGDGGERVDAGDTGRRLPAVATSVQGKMPPPAAGAPRSAAEDTATRIRAAAIAADGPGTPSRRPGEATPPPLPLAIAAAAAEAAKSQAAAAKGSQGGPVEALEPAHGKVEAATPTGDLRRPKFGARS
jgi:putative nucleotidyltransferase with HDIG domain